MRTMAARAIAGLLVTVLVGPSVVAATCEMTCAIARHHHEALASSDASCHEHEESSQGIGIAANPSPPCHESGDLPSAIVDAWLNTAAIATPPPTPAVVTPPLAARSTPGARNASAVFDPRPAHRPLRV